MTYPSVKDVSQNLQDMFLKLLSFVQKNLQHNINNEQDGIIRGKLQQKELNKVI